MAGRAKTGTESQPFIRVKLDEIGIDKKLSARSQKVGDAMTVPELTRSVDIQVNE